MKGTFEQSLTLLLSESCYIELFLCLSQLRQWLLQPLLVRRTLRTEMFILMHK
jgi:hypothetical protein